MPTTTHDQQPVECSRGNPPTTIEEAEQIALAEFRYWANVADKSAEYALGGTGAAANILAALQGLRAPWHPKPKDH